jgi:hypothetical protein
MNRWWFACLNNIFGGEEPSELCSQGRLIVCFSLKSGRPYLWQRSLFIELNSGQNCAPVRIHCATILSDTLKYKTTHRGVVSVHCDMRSLAANPLVFCLKSWTDDSRSWGDFPRLLKLYLFSFSILFCVFSSNSWFLFNWTKFLDIYHIILSTNY